MSACSFLSPGRWRRILLEKLGFIQSLLAFPNVLLMHFAPRHEEAPRWPKVQVFCLLFSLGELVEVIVKEETDFEAVEVLNTFSCLRVAVYVD